jgi:hypothetical protein
VVGDAPADAPPAPAGPRPTFGQLLGNLSPGPGGAPPPAGQPVAGEVVEVVREENRSFCQLVGYVSTNVGVLVIGDSIRRKGLEPSEPGPEDIERTTEATADALARAIGDAAVPWWAALACAWGNLYLSMRVGARPLSPEEIAQRESVQVDQQQAPPAPAPPAGTAAPVIGQGVPPPRPRPPAPAGAGSTFAPLAQVAPQT